MRRSALIAGILSVTFLGAGCAPAPIPAELPQTPPPTAAPTAGESPTEAVRSPYYIAYSPESYAAARAEGRPIVLYFWASWCPICKADEPLIKARIEGSGLPVAGFRVNFDTEDALKREYRIPYQHTTVILRPDGTESERFTGPVDEETFLAALRAAAQ